MRKMEIRRRCESNLNVIKRVNQSVLKWFERMERMSEGRLVKRVYIAEESERSSGFANGRGLSWREG